MVIDSNTILTYFKLASSEEILLEKWINGDDLCVTIGSIYNLREKSFTLKQLTKTLNTKVGKAVKFQIDVCTSSPVSKEHIGIFRQVYRPKLGATKKRPSNVYAFYFVTNKGCNPPSYNDEWYNHIIDYVDLASLLFNYKKRNADNDIVFNLV